jgi:HD-GYP domain-containing protein (c-di-GMP phosphodiesterase class II)
MRKTIGIHQLIPGMFVVGVDRSWLHTPFFSHRRRITKQEEIDQLRTSGIRQVVIDTACGTDLEDMAQTATPVSGTHERPTRDTLLGAEAHTLASDTPHSRTDETSGRDALLDTDPDSDNPAAHMAHTLQQDFARAQTIRQDMSHAIQRVFDGIKTGAPIDSQALRTIVSQTIEVLLHHQTVLTSLAMIQRLQKGQPDLYVHVSDTAVLALTIGSEHGLEAPALEHLGMGAILHDLGQIRLPQNLFHKTTAYTPPEWDLVRQHPQLGADMVQDAPDFPEDSRRIILEHHERLNGSGYPHGLTGSAISPLSQLTALVDVYDALVVMRAGRPSLSPSEAMRELYLSGQRGEFDKPLVERMIHTLGIYPVGSCVELNDGRRGVVVSVKPGRGLMPVIKLLPATSRPPVIGGNSIVDLGNARHPRLSIVRTVEPEPGVLDPANLLQFPSMPTGPYS